MRQRSRASLEWVQRPVVFAPLLLLLGFAISALVADRGLPANDEGALLTAAAKLLRGAVFYREIDAYWFPGADVSPRTLVAGSPARPVKHLDP